MKNSNLIRLRRVQKVSQKQLASMCDVSRNTISRIENGTQIPSLIIAFRIQSSLKLYNYPLRWIFSSTAELADQQPKKDQTE